MLTDPTQIAADRAVLVVSPHVDDAVLSCWSLLDPQAAAAAVGHDVLTVCTAEPAPAQVTPYDQACGFADSDTALAARLAEDAAAFAGTAHRCHRLDLLDAQYLLGPRPAEDGDRLRGWVDAWLDDVSGRRPLVVLPAGAGKQRAVRPWERGVWGRRVTRRARRLRAALTPPRPSDGTVEPPAPHADHLFVRDVLVAHLRGGTDMALYEEVPYRLAGDARQDIARLAGGAAPPVVDAPVDRAAKFARVARYASQLPALYAPGGCLDSPAALPGDERFWLLTAR